LYTLIEMKTELLLATIVRFRHHHLHGEALRSQTIQATIQVDAAVVHTDEVGVPRGGDPAGGTDFCPHLVLHMGIGVGIGIGIGIGIGSGAAVQECHTLA